MIEPAQEGRVHPSSTGYLARDVVREASPSAPDLRIAALERNVSAREVQSLPRRVLDQRDLPCCVSCALSSAMETLDSRAPALSPLFHYHVTRFDNGGANADGFVYLDDALQTLAAQGISSEDLHHPAFMESGARARPSLAAYADALTRTIARRGVRSRVVQGGAGSRAVWVREQIDQERPVLVGFQLPSTYWRAFLNERHEWLDPDAHPRSAASHCVLVVGYDDARQAAHVQDSRGAADGFDRGRWWMGYRVLDSTVVQELYALIP